MAPRHCQIQYYITLKSHWMYIILNKRVLGHKKTWKNIQLPSVDDKMKRSSSVPFWIRPVIQPVEVATRKYGGNGDSHTAYLSSVEIDVFKRTVVFINFSFSFRWTDDKSRIGTTIRVFSKPAVTAVFCATCPRKINLLSQEILLSNIGGLHVNQ
jgi:hypothetical protein